MAPIATWNIKAVPVPATDLAYDVSRDVNAVQPISGAGRVTTLGDGGRRRQQRHHVDHSPGAALIDRSDHVHLPW